MAPRAPRPAEAEAVEVPAPIIPKDENENRGAETLPVDVKRAMEAGLPKLSGKESEAYVERYGVLVRFIKQSPEKWDAEKDEQIRQLELL